MICAGKQCRVFPKVNTQRNTYFSKKNLVLRPIWEKNIQTQNQYDLDDIGAK